MYIYDNEIDDVITEVSYITISVSYNEGKIYMEKNSFDKIDMRSDNSAYRQINFLAIDTESSL